MPACNHFFSIILAAAFFLPSSAWAQPFAPNNHGTFGTDIGDSPGASFVDYDGDGDADLFVSNRDIANYLYRNDSGTFTRIPAVPLTNVSSYGSCWADYDNDGDLDAMLAGAPSYLARNDGEGKFSSATHVLSAGTMGTTGWSCAWADYDKDGYVDLFIAHPNTWFGTPNQSNHLFRNLGNGGFERITSGPIVTGVAPYTVGTWADYDEDGDLDLFVAAGPADGSTAPDFHYTNQLSETGTATFERLTDPPFNVSGDGQLWNWVDVDNDGDLDVFRTNWSGGVGGLPDQLFINDEGTFRGETTGQIVTEMGASLASVWGDYDNDGDLDVFVVRDGYPVGAANRLFMNEQEGGFVGSPIGPVTSSWGAAAADYDGDGDLDLFLPTLYGQSNRPPNALFRNDQETGNHWIKIRLVGVQTNRSAIGATVRIESTIRGEEFLEQRRDVSSQNTFNGMNDLTVHFGVADAEIIDRITIEWPSGVVDELHNVAADQTVVVIEGSSSSDREEEPETPRTTGLFEAWPNPFQGKLTVRFELARAQHTRIQVFDMLGREVTTSIDGVSPAGLNEVTISETRIADGVYWLRLTTSGGQRSRAVVLKR